MKLLRTPEARFENLPDYPFAPHYIDVDSIRMHYVDEGPADGDLVLLLHGEPSWSFLYRHMIPPLAQAGFRVVAPDLVGFGKSDKPAALSDYSYAHHVQWMNAFIEQLDLTGINLFCQDWGSLIGLRCAIDLEPRFSRIALGNGGLPTGELAMPDAFFWWRRFARWSPYFPIGKIIDRGCTTTLSDAVIAGYDAPFPGSAYKKGTRAFPRLVPTDTSFPGAHENQQAWAAYKKWEKPFLTAFSNRDPITRGGAQPWQDHVPGAQGQPHTVIKGAGHFLQEDRGPELADVLINFVRGG